jgi:hypothetical protein
MSSDLDPLVRRFHRELGEDTGYHPRQWRSILLIGVRCRIRAQGTLQQIVDRAEELGWLVRGGPRGVALTEHGVALARDALAQARKGRMRDKSRLSNRM